MDWFLIVIGIAGVAALARVFVGVRKLRNDQAESWDAKVIDRMRSRGMDPFKPYEVSFFLALPTESACSAVRQQLEAEGFAIDARPALEGGEYPFSLHASKSLRLSVPGMQELSQKFAQIAQTNGGRYDGWA